MVKLGIFCNFSYPHIGGTEEVLKNIAERMVNDYDFDVIVSSYSVDKYQIHKNVKYVKCLKGRDLIDDINSFDIIFVYSDSFWGFPSILKKIRFIEPKIFLAPVGMYDLLGNPESFKIFKENIEKFQIITHSNIYQDYKACKENNFPVTVIPNGVNPDEFNDNCIDFRAEYKLYDKKVLLCVSNFFYGKGQEYLPDIAAELRDKHNFQDFKVVLISSSIKYPHERLFMNRCQQKFASLRVPYSFVRNASREHVVGAFKQADLFVFSSRKEVAPIVILESMAAGTPWVSMDVGNVSYLNGGIVINNDKTDAKGYKIIDNLIIEKYAENILSLLTNDELYKGLSSEGTKNVEKKYNWDKICKQYYEIFTS